MARKMRTSAEPPPIPLDPDLAALWPSKSAQGREMLLLLQAGRERERARNRPGPTTTTQQGTPR